MSKKPDAISVKDLTMAYGDYTVMRSLNFSIRPSEVKVIMGGSGCGKSTLLKHLIGIETASQGEIFYSGQKFEANTDEAERIRRTFGVSFQGGALWSSMKGM